jgi:hypothetical protein
MGTRKVVQIAIASGASALSHIVYALCDDGSMWSREPYVRWSRVVDVPQPWEES